MRSFQQGIFSELYVYLRTFLVPRKNTVVAPYVDPLCVFHQPKCCLCIRRFSFVIRFTKSLNPHTQSNDALDVPREPWWKTPETMPHRIAR